MIVKGSHSHRHRQKQSHKQTQTPALSLPTHLGWRAAARSAVPTVATEHPSHLQEGGGEREVGGGGREGKL